MRYLFQLFFRILMLPGVQLFYRVRRIGTENVPRKGGVLMLGNHVSYIDAFIMYLTTPRPVRFVVLESYTKAKGIGWFLRLFGAIPIRPTHSREALMRTVDALKAGDLVCLFPEGGLTRLGVIDEFKKGFELIARKSDCQVVPFYMDGLWESVFSFERGRYFKKKPKGLFCPLQVAFGRPIPAGEATAEKVREAVMAQSLEAFSRRRDFEFPLERALVHSLKTKRRRSMFVEYGKNGPRDWSRADTLGMATTIARRWMNKPTDTSDRVGVMLPPGPMTAVINMGLFLAGKTPVNLPFTIDQEEMEGIARSVDPLGVRTVITSQAFMPHLIDFWHGDEGVFIDMKSVVSTQGSPMGLLEKTRAYLEPAWLTCWRLDLERRPLDREAVGLVPVAGESAVLLNSDELHRNAVQVQAADFVRGDDAIFTEDSLARPEGLTLGCWTPALNQGKVVARSLALREEFEPLERAILDQEVTVISGSRSFYSGIEQSLSIRSVLYGFVFGAASSWELEKWEEHLGFPLARAWSCQGRVITMSRTDPNDEALSHHKQQVGRKPEAVGRFLPGIAIDASESTLKLRFEPLADDGSKDRWLEGPRDATLDAQGFLSFPEADSLASK